MEFFKGRQRGYAGRHPPVTGSLTPESGWWCATGRLICQTSVSAPTPRSVYGERRQHRRHVDGQRSGHLLQKTPSKCHKNGAFMQLSCGPPPPTPGARRAHRSRRSGSPRSSSQIATQSTTGLSRAPQRGKRHSRESSRPGNCLSTCRKPERPIQTGHIASASRARLKTNLRKPGRLPHDLRDHMGGVGGHAAIRPHAA